MNIVAITRDVVAVSPETSRKTSGYRPTQKTGFPRRLLRAAAGALLLQLAATASLQAQAYTPPASDRVDLNFNQDWKFIKQDVPAASATAFDDSAWTAVSLPHTWNDDHFREWCSTANSTKADPMRPSGGYFGTAWYRKHFTVPAAYAGHKVILEFQGIGRMGKFWVNGTLLGTHENGIGPAGIDITNYITFGTDNVISVRVNNDQNAISEEYPGGVTWPYGVPFNVNFGGINRDVTLHIVNKTYQTFPLYRNLGTVGTYIYAKPETINTLAKSADLTIDAEVKNESGAAESATLEAAVVDESGALAYTFPATSAQNIASNASFHFVSTLTLSGVHFWSPDYPYLYQVYTILRVGGAIVDVQKITTGIRKFTFARTLGLEVNGHPLYLNGFAPRSTMEWPAVGMPPDWMTEYDFKMIRDGNGNFLRPMHGAPRKAQVQAADKFGIVMVVPAVSTENDPAIVTANDQTQWQMKLDIMRDVTIYYRNDPSVLFYEGCNGALTAVHEQDMLDERTTWDPFGGRLSGSRTNDSNVTQGIREYSSTMDGAENNAFTPLWDAEYGRAEGPRRIWDVDSPMLNPRWDGVSSANGITNPAPGTVGNTTAKYLKGGYFYTASDYHQALGLNGTDADAIGDYLYVNAQGQGGQAYFRLNNSEDMMLENLAKYWGRQVRSVFQQPPAVSDQIGVMVGGAKIIWADSDTDGRMKDCEVARTSGAVDGVRIPKETYFGMQAAAADPTAEPMVYLAGHWNYPAGTVRAAVYAVTNLPHVVLQTFSNTTGTGTPLQQYTGVTNFFPPGIGGDQINHYVFKFSNVAWQSGSVKAIAYTNSPTEAGAVSQLIATAGAPAKLRITQDASPGGWKADGSDIAMFDVEVLDANNNRCPTYEDKVSFTWSGPGTFLGGYNSGRRYSNHLPDDPSTTYTFNVEAGINRVFVRANRTPGTFTINATATGLTSASATATSTAVSVTNGLSSNFPITYDNTALTNSLTEPTPVAEGVAPPPPSNAPNPADPNAFTDMHYTGSHAEEAVLIHNIQGGEQAYKDDTTIHLPTTLPRYLIGGDFIQAFKSDADETTGTDQYQFNMNRFGYVYQVIDAANGMPNHNDNEKYDWVKLPETITVNGRLMKIYKSRLMQPYENVYLACNGKDNSLSGFDSNLGFNSSSNMYMLFTVPAEQELQNPTDVVSATDYQGSNVPANAIDANPATRWNAASGGQKVFNLDLGRNVLVGSYEINWQSADTKYYQYLVEISPDNTNWQTSLDLSANVNLGANEYRVPSNGAFAGRYVRITVSFSSGGAWPAIVDMKVWGVLDAAPAADVPTITSGLTGSGQGGYNFTYTATASGSPTGFTATGLPDGWTMNGNTGVISGITLDSGTFPITISGINTDGAGAAVLNVTLAPPPPVPVITSGLTYTTQAGVAIPTASAYVITASNMTYTPSSFSATLPSGLGLAVSTSTGKITGTPKYPGTYTIPIHATNPGGAGPVSNLAFTVTPNGAAPTITSPATASATAFTAFSYQIAGTGTPTLFAATNLPPGLSVSTSTGLISGTPTTPGTYSTVTISASNAGGTATANLTITVAVNPNAPVITSPLTASGNQNIAFTYQIVATNTPTSYSATPLPVGLVCSATTGAITGTPTSASLGTTNTVIKATNANGSDSETLVITISNPPPKPVLKSPLNSMGAISAAFSYQIVATNTPTNYTATGLPPGLSLSPTTGAISGTPTTAGTYSVTLGASNAGGSATAQVVSMVIKAAGADINLALNQTVTDSSEHSTTNTGAKAVDGDATGTRWESNYTDSEWLYVDLGAAQTIHSIGITWDNAAGKNYNLQGTNDPNGTWTDLVPPIVGNTVGGTANPLTYTVSGNPSYRYVRMNGTLRKMTQYGFSIYEFQVWGPAGTVVSNAPSITSPLTASATAGTAFSYTIAASHSPTSFNALGLSGTGLSVNTTTGVISGTPTSAGTISSTISATNGSGTDTKTLVITVASAGNPPVISSPLTASATAGMAFSYSIVASNSPTSYNATALSGTGLSINTSTGVISGTPTAGGTITSTITATNGIGSDNETLTITVAVPAPVISSPLTASATAGTAFSYSIVASNSPTSYNATALSGTGLSINTTTGVISGTPTAAGTITSTITATNGTGSDNETLVITVAAGATDTNVAQGLTAVTASSVQAGNDIVKGNEGSLTSRWAAADGTFPQWWMVDLGSNKTLSRMDIAWYSSATRYYKYKIETSTDGTTFNLGADKTTNATFGDTTDPISGAAATARYVRVTITGASAGFASAYEFKPFGH